MNAERIWVKNHFRANLLRVKSIYEVINLFFTYLSAFFQNLKISSPFLPLTLAFDALISLFLQIKSSCDQLYAGSSEIFYPWFMISFSGNGRTLSRKVATLPLLPNRTCHSFSCYPLAPISVPQEICAEDTKNIKKDPKNHFQPFFPPSDVSLFHTRSSTQEKISSVFVLLSHSLKLSVNEIEVPFTNSILIKNGTR